VLRRAEIDAIRTPEVVVRTPDGPRTVTADKVFVLIGHDLPSDLLASAGVRVKTHRGEPIARV
jgi:hypothetical protein